MTCCKPCFHKYPQQNKPQPAFINFYENGDIKYGYSPTDSCESDLYYSVILNFRINPSASSRDIEILIKKIMPYARLIFQKTKIESNRRIFSDESEGLYYDAQLICDSHYYDNDMCEDDDCEYCRY